MFGYVRARRADLLVREDMLYRGVYCGLCRAMGRCTGQCSRLTLSYDMVFLYLVRASLAGIKPDVQPGWCAVHPFHRRPIARRDAELDYAARVSALLVYGKICDDLADERGIRRFGFLLPMDETLARCALDISGRPYLTFKAKFKHHKVGDMSTEMVEHFFRSLAQTMGVTLNLKAQGRNDHHVAEGLFKAFGRTLRDAVKIEGSDLPSSKGVL